MDLYDDELSHGVLRAGQELLWTAASLGNMSDVQGLVSMKCPLDVANPHEGNSTPLIVASRKGHFDVVQFLMRKGADVRLVTDQGHTALHAAAESANLQVVKYLLANAADGTAFARLKDKRGRDAATVAKDCRANLVQRLLGKYLQDPKSCGLAPDRNLQLARLARERESRSRGVATADASDSAARQGNPRPQPQRPGIQHTGASATVSRRRAATAPDPHVNARKKRGIFGLRDLPQNSSSSDSDSEGSSSTVASDEVGRAGDDAEDYDDDDDDGDMQGDSGDDSVSVGESGNGMLDDSDLADMGLGSLPDSPTRDRALMLQRIDESMIPDAVRAAARRVYLASYTQWRKGSLPRPHRLEEAIELGKAALEDRPGVGSAAASHHERRAEKQGRATRSRADGREERRAARKANLRPSIYRDDGSLSPSAAASVTGHGNSGGGGGGASHTSAFHRAKQDAAWASLGHETTLDAAAQIEYYKAALKNEKAAKVDLRRQLKQLRKKLKASASKVAGTWTNNAHGEVGLRVPTAGCWHFP